VISSRVVIKSTRFPLIFMCWFISHNIRLATD